MGNWVVHTKLSKSHVADRIILSLNDWLHSPVDEKSPNREEIEKLLWHEAFRKELKECLAFYGLPITFCTSDVAWDVFEDHLVRVIGDSPLMIQDESRRAKSLVSVSIKRNDHPEDDDSKVMWSIHLGKGPFS